MRFQFTTAIAFGTTFSFLKENEHLLWGEENLDGTVYVSVTDDGMLNFVAVVPNFEDDRIYGLSGDALDKQWNRKVLRLFLSQGWELLDEPVSFAESLANAVRGGWF